MLFARNGGQLLGDGGQLQGWSRDGDLSNVFTEYNGNDHEQGGIAIGQDAEVEDGEVRWKDYIFSDTLAPSKEYQQDTMPIEKGTKAETIKVNGMDYIFSDTTGPSKKY